MTTSAARELAPEFAALPPEQQTHLRKIADRLDPPPKAVVSTAKEYEGTIEGLRKAVSNAQEAGFIIINGTPNTLLVDLDGTAELREDVLKLVSDLFKEVPTKSQWKSKDGIGTHVVLRFEKTTFTEAEAVAMEAALGSDLKRAALAILRLKNSAPQPRVLFQPPAPQPIELPWMVT